MAKYLHFYRVSTVRHDQYGDVYRVSSDNWHACNTLEEAQEGIVKHGGHIIKTVDVIVNVKEGTDDNSSRSTK